MRIKLNKQQLLTITQLVRDIEMIEETVYDKLVTHLMKEVYKKLYNASLFPKDKNGITLNDGQKIAFLIFFSKADLSQMPYEHSLIRSIIYYLKP